MPKSAGCFSLSHWEFVCEKNRKPGKGITSGSDSALLTESLYKWLWEYSETLLHFIGAPKAENVRWVSLDFKTILTWTTIPSPYTYSVKYYWWVATHAHTHRRTYIPIMTFADITIIDKQYYDYNIDIIYCQSFLSLRYQWNSVTLPSYSYFGIKLCTENRWYIAAWLPFL